MHFIDITLQLIIACGIFNVWLIRYHRVTKYRGGGARSLKDEFSAYGLPAPVFYFVGFLKLTAALMLLLAIVFPLLLLPAATTIAVLMTGAILMHAKVRDPLQRYLPAACMLILSLILII